jgi:phosphoribosyl-ATP pyrophosphohydrolase
MSDSLERLYQAVIAARDLDPATSRTARLFQRGPSKMAKKLAEEAIEVVIDAVNGNTEAVVRESADLLYNLTVLWAAAGVKPEDVWREMARREDLLGIAEKLPKSAVQPIEKPEAKLPKAVPDKALAAKSLPAKSLAAKSLPAKSLPAKSLNKPLAKAVAPSAVRRRIVALEGRSSHKRH